MRIDSGDWSADIKDVITQGDLELCFKYWEESGTANAHRLVRDGGLIRAAVRAGIITGIAEAEIDGAEPAKIRWLAIEFDKRYTELLTLPPKA